MQSDRRRAVAGESSLDSPVAKVVAEVVAERYGDDAWLLPMLCPALTDTHAYRAAEPLRRH